MSWVRAALAGALVVFVAFVVLVYVPDLLVSSLSGVGRSTRVALATAEFTVAVGVLLWALRRLQARGLRR
jgi:hypothetical protein